MKRITISEDFMNLLIVDDEYNIRNLMKTYITRNYKIFKHVEVSSEAVTAIKIAKKISPNIVISDVVMPGMNGIELIKRIKEFLPDCYFIMISGHDESEYIRNSMRNNAVDYILKPIDVEEFDTTLKKVIGKLASKKEVEEKLKQMENQLKANRLLGFAHIYKALLDQELFDYDDIIEQFELYDVKIDINREMICVCICMDYDINDKVTFRTRELSKILTINVIEKYLLESKINHLICPIDQQVIGIIMNIRNSDIEENDITQLCYTLRNLIISSLNRPVVFGIGNSCKNFSDIADICKSAIRAVLEAMVSETNIVTYNESLSSNINWLNILEISSVFKEMYRKNYWKSSQTIVGQHIIDTLVSQVLDNNEYYSCNLSISQKLVKQAVDIIENEYSKPINLQSIAYQLKISPNYLGALFKETTGKKFSEALTTRRMNIAKSLILFESITINEISDKVGYDDSNYFSKVFKKHFDFSPSEYREKNKL